MSAEAGLVWCPFPSEEEARSVISTLLDEGLVACANIIPGMISLYDWKGERGETREVGVLLKTHGSRLGDLSARLVQLHSYESPAIMHWDVAAFPDSTQLWLEGLQTGNLHYGQD